MTAMLPNAAKWKISTTMVVVQITPVIRMIMEYTLKLKNADMEAITALEKENIQAILHQENATRKMSILKFIANQSTVMQITQALI